MITSKIIQELKDEIIECGSIAEYYIKNDQLQVITKPDGSPVSNGDIEVSQRLTQKLHSLLSIPVVSEESDNNHLEKNAHTFWLIDPIDGTYKYIEGHPHYTINVGLIEHGEPKYGFIYNPHYKIMYYIDHDGNFIIEHNGVHTDRTIRKDPLEIKGLLPDKNDWRIRSENFLLSHNVGSSHPYSGSSKLTQIAHGYADVYPKLDLCMEWDVAAGHAILKAIGGGILDKNYEKLVYGKPDFIVPHFIAFNDRWMPYKDTIQKLQLNTERHGA